MPPQCKGDLCKPLRLKTSSSDSHSLPVGAPKSQSSPYKAKCEKFQARVLEWVVIPFFRGSPRPRGWAWVFCTAGRFFTVWATKEVPQSQEAIKYIDGRISHRICQVILQMTRKRTLLTPNSDNLTSPESIVLFSHVLLFPFRAQAHEVFMPFWHVYRISKHLSV